MESSEPKNALTINKCMTLKLEILVSALRTVILCGT